MKKYDYITIVASIVIISLQVVCLNRLYQNYIDKKITEITGVIQFALEKELDLRLSDKVRNERNMNYKRVSDMKPEERDSLLIQLDPDDNTFINLKDTSDDNQRKKIAYILFQVEQDKVLQNDSALNLKVLDSIYMSGSIDDYVHTFLLYDENKSVIDSIGKLSANNPDYSSKLWPIGIQGAQYLQFKGKIPMSGFIKSCPWEIILSVCLMLFGILWTIYQLTGIRQKNNLLRKREASVNGTINDFKAPLNSIISALGWFRTKTEDANIIHLIEENQASARNLIYNIESLLVTARKDRQRIILNKTKVSVPAIVEKVKNELSSLYKDKFNSIIIINNLPNNYRINADSMYIENVIRILIDNALKYSDDNVSVKITLMIIEKKLQVSVKDNGWGIAPKYQRKLFRQFYQVPRRKVRKREGLGIGLSQAKYIIDEHGGQIQVKSTEDKGSVFSFVIPV